MPVLVQINAIIPTYKKVALLTNFSQSEIEVLTSNYLKELASKTEEEVEEIKLEIKQTYE